MNNIVVDSRWLKCPKRLLDLQKGYLSCYSRFTNAANSISISKLEKNLNNPCGPIVFLFNLTILSWSPIFKVLFAKYSIPRAKRIINAKIVVFELLRSNFSRTGSSFLVLRSFNPVLSVLHRKGKIENQAGVKKGQSSWISSWTVRNSLDNPRCRATWSLTFGRSLP